MPRISTFYGIVIAMYFNDHAPPHFHAAYGEYEAVFRIDNLGLHEGRLPGRASALVLEWAFAHVSELEANWARAQQGVALQPIEPLQ